MDTPRHGVGGGDRGVCDPAQLLGTMIVMVVSFALRESAPPELTLAFSPELGSIRGLFCFCVQHYNLG